MKNVTLDRACLSEFQTQSPNSRTNRAPVRVQPDDNNTVPRWRRACLGCRRVKLTVLRALDHSLRLDDIGALLATLDDRAYALAAAPDHLAAPAPGQRLWHAGRDIVWPAAAAEGLR